MSQTITSSPTFTYDPFYTGSTRSQPNPENEKAFRSAFMKAKRAFKPVIASTENSFFKSKYASLADYHHAVDEALLANGFTLHQLFASDHDGNYLLTKLAHVDGYSEISRIRLMDAADPQKMGSLLTYMRRYSLAAILGVPSEDDDGNTASSESKTPKTAMKPTSSGAFQFTFGKFKGKSFAEIPTADLEGYLNWLLGQKDAEKNKYIFDAYNEWAKKPKNTHKDFEEPPPYDDDDMPNPFG